MRAALSIAALAVGALAVPYKREIVAVTDVNVVYVTAVVTVTAGQAEPSAYVKPKHHGHKHVQPVAQSPAAPTYEAPAYPAYTPEPVYSAPAPVETPVYSAPAPAAPPSGYSEIVVAHHNLHRANHSADPLVWDEQLASCAATIAASCVYAHDTSVDGGGYGQNIAAGVEANNVSAIITDLFYNGELPYYTGYGQPDPDMSLFEKWGHFSQIVWKGTTSVGCATQYCPNGLANVGTGVQPYFTVCNYKGPGNYAGEYGTNVMAPLGQPGANWNTLN